MKSIVVTKIRFASRAVSVSYISDGRQEEAILYRRSDFSWQFDPETRDKGEKFMEVLQKQIFLTLTPKKQKEKKRPHRSRDTWFAG